MRSARLRNGLTQVELGQLAGVSRRHIIAVESGANISVALLVKLATELGITELRAGPAMLSVPAAQDRELALPEKTSHHSVALAERLAVIEAEIASVRVQLERHARPHRVIKRRPT